MFGPPAVGKTTVAQKLSHLYKLHHVMINEVTEEKVTHWVSGSAAAAQHELRCPLVEIYGKLFKVCREINTIFDIFFQNVLFF